MEVEADVALQLDPKLTLGTYLKNNIRPDGRQLNDIKRIVLRTNTNSKCCGSSLVRWGKTIISCEVMAQVGTPLASSPSCGAIVFDVALWPICSPDYDKIKKSDEALALEATLRDIYLKSDSIPLDQLCITPGRHAFCLSIQVICLSLDGSLLDSTVLAISSALRSTSLPSTSLDTNGQVIFIEDDISHPLELSRHLVSLSCGIFLPSSISLSPSLLIDPGTNELAVDHLLSLVTDQHGDLAYLSQHSNQNGVRVNGLSLELSSVTSQLIVDKSKQHLFPLLNGERDC